jgi:hypothetical protein
MSDDAFSARRRLSRGRRVSADDRHGRHLELVTDRWIAELAELVVLQPRASHTVDGVRPRLVRTPDRDARPGSAPSGRVTDRR